MKRMFLLACKGPISATEGTSKMSVHPPISLSSPAELTARRVERALIYPPASPTGQQQYTNDNGAFANRPLGSSLREGAPQLTRRQEKSIVTNRDSDQ